MKVPPIRRIAEPTVEDLGNRLLAIFKLSEAPDSAWIRCFKERAAFSMFDVQNAIFERDKIRIELPRKQDLDELKSAVDRFIEGANLDYGGPARPPVAGPA